MKKSLRQPVAILLAVLIGFSSFVANGVIASAAGVSQTVACWEFKDSNVPIKIPATGGVQADKDGCYLTSNTGKPYGYATVSLNTTGWDNGTNSKYWEIQVSSRGYDSLILSAKTRSSGTGPRDFKVQYSTDGGTRFADVPGSDYKVGGDGKATTLSNWMPDLALPGAAANQDILTIRLIMTGNDSVGGKTTSNPTGTVGSTGVSNINSVFVYGEPVTSDSNVAGVVADPADGSAVAKGQELSLTCETDGATIRYKINSGSEQIYDPSSKPKLNDLPATVVAYATKAGKQPSVPTTFSYTQAAVESVTAKPNGGGIKPGDPIVLKCATPGAQISYSTDNGQTWIPYTVPFTLAKLPATVFAKASAPGMLDSAQTSFIFNERLNSDYNIYFGQLHSHTTNSDGIGTVQEAFDHASKVKDLDFLAVTDHSNSLEDVAGTASLENGSSSTKWLYGKQSAREITEKRVTKGDHTFLGIYGFEMTWSNGIGHINTYNTNGFENRNATPFKATNALSNYYTRLVANPDSISQFNHPGTTFGDFNDFSNYNPQIDRLITMIEVGNGEGPIRGSGYFPSYEYYTRALDKGWHVAPTNNQDNHKGLWGDANTARSVILADTLTEDSLYDAMRNRRVYATEDQNLKIRYMLNDEVMGTILDSKPDEADIDVKLSDPDSEPIGRVDVIVNGGKIAATKTVTASDADVTFNLPANYSYYYIKVTQPDKDIAVTAPVWIGEVDKAGIAKTSANTKLPVKGEELTITSSLYNNESVSMEVQSLEYSVDGTVIHSENGIGTLAPLSTKDVSFPYTSDKSGGCNIGVRMVATINGVEKIFTDVLKLNFSDPKIITRVLIDGTHRNDYVNGYYANNMGNFTAIAAADQIQVKVEENEITREMLEDTSLLVITAPAKKAGTANGVSYTPQTFSDDFIAMVKEYVNNGGTAIVCGLADYQDSAADPYTSSTQINDLLQAVGVKTTINSDEVVDDTNNGGQKYRLYLTGANTDSPYLKGLVDGQKYSFYSGCTVNPGENAAWLIKGYETTYSINSKMTNGKYESTVPASSGTAPYDETKAVKKQGDVCVLAQENVGKGKVFVGGTVFLSDFEVKAAMDSYSDLQYTNYTIVTNILDSIKRELEASKIGEVRKQAMGETFAVEGTVTAGTQPGNAFFDTIYIQDETGGINIFPINSGDIKVGQKVRVVGSLDEYLGDLELRVISADVTDPEIHPLAPEEITTEQAADYAANGGKLVKIQGTVTKAALENNVLSYMLVKDGSGKEVRVFIDGYIGSSAPLSTPLEKLAQVGNSVSAVGLVSYDPDGPRIRVRDRAEIQAGKSDEALDAVKEAIKQLPDGSAPLTEEQKAAVQNAIRQVLALNLSQQGNLETAHVQKLEALIEKSSSNVKKSIPVPATGAIAKPEDRIQGTPSVSGLLLAAGITGSENGAQSVTLKINQTVPTTGNAVLAMELNLEHNGTAIHDLQFPVTVSFRFPASFHYNPDMDYQIFHQKNGGGSEYLPLDITGEPGSYTGTFTTSSFSAFTVLANDGSAVPVTGISLSRSAMTLTVGYSSTLTATVKPDNASKPAVLWASSNPGVASVTGGKVTALKAGAAVITATAGTKSASCTVTVLNPSDDSKDDSDKTVPVVKNPVITYLSDTTADFGINGTYQLKITSTDGKAPNVTAGTGGVFSIQLVGTTGNDYFFKLSVIGAVGQRSGIYVNGIKLLVATAASTAPADSNVKSDTTLPFTVKSGFSYILKLTTASKPVLVTGTSSAFKAELVKVSGNDYFFKITAIGKAGASSGLYINREKNPTAVASVVK